MGTHYRRFPVPSIYARLKKGDNRIFLGLLSHVNPRSNPDLTEAYAQVHEWFFEFGEDGQTLLRQVGLNKEGMPVLRAPFKGDRGENGGFWRGIPIKIGDEDMLPLDETKFLNAWEQTRIFYVGVRSLPLPVN